MKNINKVNKLVLRLTQVIVYCLFCVLMNAQNISTPVADSLVKSDPQRAAAIYYKTWKTNTTDQSIPLKCASALHNAGFFAIEKLYLDSFIASAPSSYYRLQLITQRDQLVNSTLYKNDAEIQKLYAEAVSFESSFQYDNALDRLNKIVVINPNMQAAIEAKARVEEAGLYQRYKADPTVQNSDVYLAKFPEGKYAQEVKSGREKLIYEGARYNYNQGFYSTAEASCTSYITQFGLAGRYYKSVDSILCNSRQKLAQDAESRQDYTSAISYYELVKNCNNLKGIDSKISSLRTKQNTQEAADVRKRKSEEAAAERQRQITINAQEAERKKRERQNRIDGQPDFFAIEWNADIKYKSFYGLRWSVYNNRAIGFYVGYRVNVQSGPTSKIDCRSSDPITVLYPQSLFSSGSTARWSENEFYNKWSANLGLTRRLFYPVYINLGVAIGKHVKSKGFYEIYSNGQESTYENRVKVTDESFSPLIEFEAGLTAVLGEIFVMRIGMNFSNEIDPYPSFGIGFDLY